MQDKQQAQEAQEITIDTSGYNPAADPGNPAFDMATWQAAVDKAGGLEKMIAGIKAALPEPAERARAYMRLSMGQIDQLPQEERELVWDEFARQLAEQPGVIAFMEAATSVNWAAIGDGIAAAAQGAKRTIDAIVPALTAAAENWKAIGTNLITAGINAKKAIDALLDTDGIQDTLQTWEALLPYMDAEYDENPDKYSKANFSDLIAAAARRARADGKQIPTLKAEQGQAEQITMDLNLPTEETDKEETRRKRIEAAHKRREIARQQGALISADTNLAIIADKELGFDYFTSAVIKNLPQGIENYILDDQGRLNLYDLTGGDKDVNDVLQEVDSLHTAFLMWLLGLAWNNSDIRETNSGNAIMPVYLPAVLESMKIDPRPRERDKQTKELIKRDTSKPLADLRRDKFMEFIRPLLNTAAFFGDDLYQIVGFYSYNADSETMYITAPYMFRLVEYAKLRATKHGAIVNVFHADIMTENQIAVDVADRIAMGVITRGVSTPDAETYNREKKRKPIKKKTTSTAADGTKTVEELTFAPEPEATVSKSRTDENGVTVTVTTPRARKKTYSFAPKFSTIIADCPQLQRELDEIRSSGSKDKSQRVNKKLKDIFTAAIRIIMEKSDMPKYYKNLTFTTEPFDTFKAPTNSTLNAILKVSHEGKDPNFSK